MALIDRFILMIFACLEFIGVVKQLLSIRLLYLWDLCDLIAVTERMGLIVVLYVALYTVITRLTYLSYFSC